MSKSFKYVTDFEFPADKGFVGSAGKIMVKGYARGGKAACPAKKPKPFAEGGPVKKESLVDRAIRKAHEEYAAEQVAKKAAPKASAKTEDTSLVGVLSGGNPFRNKDREAALNAYAKGGAVKRLGVKTDPRNALIKPPANSPTPGQLARSAPGGLSRTLASARPAKAVPVASTKPLVAPVGRETLLRKP